MNYKFRFQLHSGTHESYFHIGFKSFKKARQELEKIAYAYCGNSRNFGTGIIQKLENKRIKDLVEYKITSKFFKK